MAQPHSPPCRRGWASPRGLSGYEPHTTPALSGVHCFCSMSSPVSVLQLNLNNCRLAQDLLWQTAGERCADFVCVCEPYEIRSEWHVSLDSKCAIWFRPYSSSDFDVVHCSGRGDGFVIVETRDFCIGSCYLSPNLSFSALDHILTALSSCVLRSSKPFMLCGDFNARSPAWGSESLDSRGRLLELLFSELGIDPVCSDGGPSFHRGAYSSRIDFAVGSPILLSRLTRSTVFPDFTGSDHSSLLHNFSFSSPALVSPSSSSSSSGFPWLPRSGPIDLDVWFESLSSSAFCTRDFSDSSQFFSRAEIDSELSCLQSLFDSSRPSLPLRRKRRRDAPWWSEELALLRRETRKTSDLYRYTLSRDPALASELALPAYLMPRRTFRSLLCRRKNECFQEMVGEVRSDVWGRPYKTMMKKLRGDQPPVSLNREEFRLAMQALFVCVPDPAQVRNFSPANSSFLPISEEPASLVPNPGASSTLPAVSSASSSFPHVPFPGFSTSLPALPPSLVHNSFINPDGSDIPICPLTVAYSLARIGPKKVPGPDGMTGEVIRVIGRVALTWLTKLFNSCYSQGYFPSAWKSGRLVLIPKANKPYTSLGDLRPLCMLPHLSKGFEYCIRERLLEAVRVSGGFSPRQFGFLSGRSTMQAMRVVTSEWDRARSSNCHCLLVTLDVKNAFNTLKWENILRAAVSRNFPPSLIRVLDSYLSNRQVGTFLFDGSWIEVPVFAGVPQGSVLGPLLWILA
nr:PREDICTED: RNA-directed DNA polymerase from mobile element jockey-like [Megachile rotundata]